MVEREWYRVEEAAEVLGLSRSLTYRLVAEGVIPSVRINRGRVVRVPVQGLREWAESEAARQFTQQKDGRG
jgi:excisionase family DNA binding protein